MSNWNPVTHPYRAMWYIHSSTPGCYGWSTAIAGMFATLEEAQAAMCDSQIPRRAIKYGVIDFAKNAGTWARNGGWKKVGGRIYPQELHNAHVITFKRNRKASQG